MAESAFKIELDLEDTKFSSKFDASMDSAGERVRKLKDEASKVTLGGAGFSSGGGGGNNAGRGGGLADPWARADAARAARITGEAKGASAEELRNLRYQEARTGRSARSADKLINGQTFSGKVGDALMTSRIGAGGLMPLMSKLAGIVGPEGLAVAGALTAGYQAFQAGSESRHALGSARFTSGGTYKEVGQMSGIGAFLGMSPGDAADSAVAFGQSLHGSTFGGGYMRTRGITDFGGAQVDKAKNWLAGTEALWAEKNEATAIRVARDTGMTSVLWGRNLSKDQQQSLIDMGRFESSPDEQRKEAQWMMTKAQASGWWDAGVRDFADQVQSAGPVAWATSIGIAGMTGGTAGAYATPKRIQGAFDAVQNTIEDTFSWQNLENNWGRLTGQKNYKSVMHDPNARPLSTDAKGLKAWNDKQDAQKSHNNPNASGVSDDVRVTPGMVGGASRARGGWGAAWKSAELNDALYGHAQALGGF